MTAVLYQHSRVPRAETLFTSSEDAEDLQRKIVHAPYVLKKSKIDAITQQPVLLKALL